MDFGFSNDPTTLVKVAIDEKRKIIYAHELHYKSDKGLEDVCDILRQNTPPQAEIIADSAEGRLITDVRKRGFNIKAAKKGPDSISAGIKLIEDYKIIVSESSYNLRKELNNYRWSDKRSKNPVDDYNHLIDALRYVVLWRKFSKKSVRYSIS
jgi:phage terminase large subunit